MIFQSRVPSADLSGLGPGAWRPAHRGKGEVGAPGMNDIDWWDVRETTRNLSSTRSLGATCPVRAVRNAGKAHPGVRHPGLTRPLRWVATACLVLAAAGTAAGQAEFHYQYGKLVNPFSGARENTSILTVQHATGWGWGDSFFFLDILDDGLQDGFNDKDLYGEWYPTLSLGKVSGRTFRLGPIRDISVIGGINFGADANVLKYLPGVRASWKVPGFAFLNTDLTAYIDGNSGAGSGGAPRTSNSFMFNVSWALPFRLGGQPFLMGGHAEYIGPSTDEFGNRVKSWVLAQPQLTWDLGAVFGAANHLLVGIEFQYWRNKLGVEEDEYVPQLLVIWRF